MKVIKEKGVNLWSECHVLLGLTSHAAVVPASSQSLSSAPGAAAGGFIGAEHRDPPEPVARA